MCLQSPNACMDKFHIYPNNVQNGHTANLTTGSPGKALRKQAVCSISMNKWARIKHSRVCLFSLSTLPQSHPYKGVALVLRRIFFWKWRDRCTQQIHKLCNSCVRDGRRLNCNYGLALRSTRYLVLPNQLPTSGWTAIPLVFSCFLFKWLNKRNRSFHYILHYYLACCINKIVTS